jgi:cytochrome c oxidase subunit 2
MINVLGTIQATLASASSTLAAHIFSTEFWKTQWLRKDAATRSGLETDALAMWIWWFCVWWFVGLMVLMVYFVIKYRRRAGAGGQVSPRSASHNTPLEIAWTVIPTIFLVYMFLEGFWGYMDKFVAPQDATEMRMVGFKWNWGLTYPNGQESDETKVISAKEISIFYMPANKPIRMRLSSNDVTHGFYVPDFRIKVDVMHNRYSSIWFEANAPGPDAPILTEKDTKKKEMIGVPYEDHWLFCSEYCGDDHSEMAGIIRVVPEQAYNKWLLALEGNKSSVEIGKQIHKSKCSACHSVDGSKNTGPTWKDLYGRDETLTDGSKVKVDPAYLRESILVPSAKIVAGYSNQMTLMPLTEKQIDGLIDYMRTISVHTPPGEMPSADAKAPETKTEEKKQ